MKRHTKRYLLLGAAFGASFPVFSTLIQAWIESRSFSLAALIGAQQSTPLLWVIDTAPVFLGLFAALAGRAQDALEVSLEKLQGAHTKLEHAHTQVSAQSQSLSLALEAKGQFLARMSHELRTPLNVIIGFSRIVLERAGDELSARPKRHLGMVLDSGEQLLRLVNDMLDLERIDSGRVSVDRRKTDVRALLRSIRESSLPAIQAAGLEESLVLPKEPLWMETDVDRLRQVITNLLNNSIKYAERGEIRIAARVDADGLEIEVSDTGVGIPKEQLEQIFQPFHQVDNTSARSKDGTGLGLSIVRKLTELLGGSVAVVSEADKGATFTLRFPPGLLATAELRTEPENSLVDGRGKGLVILVIDDKKELLELVRHELSEAGFRVHVAASGEVGLRKARELKPDAIVLDIIMPGMDGWEVLRQLRADPDLSDVRVVISSMLDDAPRAADFAIDAWLTKPVDTERFTEVLRRSAAGAKPDVLVVEDDPNTQELISISLRSLEARVRTVGTGGAALEAFEDRVPNALVLDLGLPDMSGFELLAQIRARPDARTLTVVVYTGAELTPEERQRLQGDLVAVVEKHSSSGVHSMVELVAAAVAK